MIFTLVDHRGTHHVRAGFQQPVESITSITGNYLHHQYQPEQTHENTSSADSITYC